MRCCAKCPRIDLTSLESDDQNLNFSPTICFHVHHIIARWTVHDRHPFNENRQCWFCESYTDSIVTAKLYTGKELVMMETSVLVFHQKLYIPDIQKLALHLLHVYILGTHHCVNSLWKSFKYFIVYHSVLWCQDYADLVVPSFSHQLQSEYYSSNIYVSIQGIVLEQLSNSYQRTS